jgi:quinol monooxygenase YgiN
MFIEQWTDVYALDHYLSSEDFHALMGAIKVLGNLENVDLFEPESIDCKR